MSKTITPVLDALLAFNHALEVYNVERGNTLIQITTGDRGNDRYLNDRLRLECEQYNLQQTVRLQRASWPSIFEIVGMEVRVGK